MRTLSRRRLMRLGLAVVAAGAAVGTKLPSETATAQRPSGKAEGLPVSGQPVPQLASFDGLVQQVMARWGLQGGALALAKDGRLVFSRAYGFADVAAGQPFQPSSLCRIASDSKPFTAMTILRLLDAGKVSLDDKAFRILTGLQPPANASIDPRLYDITVQ